MRNINTTPPRNARVPRGKLCLALALAIQGHAALAASPATGRDALMTQVREERGQGHRVDALRHLQALLDQWPDDREAQAMNVTLLTELGATSRARELAPRLQPAASAVDIARIDADHAAHEIRWADGEPADPNAPYAEADKAVTDARRLADDPSLPADLRRRASLDLLVALDKADRPDEVIQRYEALKKEGVELPAYAERAVANSLLTRRRPFESAAVFEDSIRKDPGPYVSTDSEPRIGLMYAYAESGQTDKAFATIDELAAKEQPWVRLRGIRLPIQNPRKVDADLNAATLRSSVGMPRSAYDRLYAMNQEAPANSQIRRELGNAELARGWPRRALDEFHIATTLDRRDIGALVGEAEAYRTLNDYEQVDEILAEVRLQANRDGRVERAERAWDHEKGWQFDLSTEQGKGSSPDYGDRDGTTQATVASPLIDDHWRVLALGRYSTADLPEGDVRRTRFGVGIRGYAQGFMGYVQALPAADRYVGKTALETGFDWSLTDHWAVAADYSTAGDDTPLRAQYYGISAKTLDTAVTWRASELTQARLGVSRDKFSDGNTRTSWLGSVTQRLHTAPNLTLDGGVELGGSMNTDTDRPYFNPRRDNSYALTGRLENLLGQVYERSITQRIDVAVGQYAEKGYATDWIATVKYGQEWQAREGLRFGWALGWHNQPYDGRREHRVVLDLTLHWGE